MTEQNMKRLYEHYVGTGNTVEAEKILAIPRYAKFKVKDNSEEKETKPKKVK